MSQIHIDSDSERRVMKANFYGYTTNNLVQGENLTDVESVAKFIIREGQTSDVIVVDYLDNLVCSTFGIFVDRCPNKEFLMELLKHLVPLQNRLFETGVSNRKSICNLSSQDQAI